ncbi:MAG: hypothetical protein U1F10_10215 [Burkholderiales bacterium]
MKKITGVTAVAIGLFAAIAYAQMPMVDAAANRVVQKYQAASCEQLWANRGKPGSPEEERAIAFLKQDAAARQEFFSRIAGPVMNKMFECGMIP